MFAVGPRFDVSWVDIGRSTSTTSCSRWSTRASAARASRPSFAARATSRHICAADGNNLVAFPEDLGLMAAFTGTKGAPARSATSLVGAVIGLLGSYAPEIDYYTAKFPSLANRRRRPTRALALALTDTFGRAAVETYAELAARYHVWLEAGVNMAQSWQKVCTAAGSRMRRGQPGKVAQLRSPDEPERQYAYEATTDKAVEHGAASSTRAGGWSSKQVKAYLTPIELPGQLDLAPGDVMHGVSAVDTAVGRLGFVTSKDAWMPDLTERLDEEGVQILVQPEFFVNDTIKTSGPVGARQHQGRGLLRSCCAGRRCRRSSCPSSRATSSTSRPTASRRSRSSRGRRRTRAARSWASRASRGSPPCSRGSSATRAPRRVVPRAAAAAGRAGAKLLPTSNVTCADAQTVGPCRGGAARGRALPRRDDRAASVASRIARAAQRGRWLGSRGVQRNVALSRRRGGRVVAAFEQDGRVLVARSADGGAHWAKPVAPARPARGSGGRR